MKLLMENWRSFLKEAKGGGVHPKILQIIDELRMNEGYIKLESRSSPWQVHDILVMVPGMGYGLEDEVATIRIKHVDPSDCMPDHKVWIVSYSHTEEEIADGWGPLMYEVAIELASQDGDGLAPDREQVSGDARGVWKKYFDRTDLDAYHLDINFDTTDNIISDDELEQLTPNNDGDDCQVTSSFKKQQGWGWKSKEEVAGTKWSEDPVSYVYHKKTTPTLDLLASWNMLVW